MIRIVAVLVALLLVAASGDDSLSAQETGRVQLAITASGAPAPSRIHLRDATGKMPKVTGWPAWNDHIVCAADATFIVPVGRYEFDIEKGPEFSAASGELTVTAAGPNVLKAELS